MKESLGRKLGGGNRNLDCSAPEILIDKREKRKGEKGVSTAREGTHGQEDRGKKKTKKEKSQNKKFEKGGTYEGKSRSEKIVPK